MRSVSVLSLVLLILLSLACGQTADPEPTSSEPGDAQTPETELSEWRAMPDSIREARLGQKRGIGIGRAGFLAEFTAITFEESALDDGRERLMGVSPDGHTMLELIGPPEDLHKVTLLTAVGNDRPEWQLLAMADLMKVMEVIFPTSEMNMLWAPMMMERLADSPNETIVREQDGIRVTLKADYAILGGYMMVAESG